MIRASEQAAVLGAMAAIGDAPLLGWDRAAPDRLNTPPKLPKKRNKAAAVRDRIQRQSRRKNRRKK